MCAKVSASKNRKLDKPIPRTRIGQSPIIILFSIVVLGYAYFCNRQIGEICLGPTIGCGIFFIERLLLFLLELIHRNSFDFSHTLKLVTEPSSTSQEDQSGYGFWIRLIFVTVGVTQLPPLDKWFEIKVDVLILLLTIIVGIHFQWYDCALLECYRLEKPLSYSGGSAMAFSFYYGYLKLIAPGLVNRINQFRDNEGIYDDQIPQKKLFILIPSSSFVFDKLEGYQQCTKTKDLKIDHVAEKFYHHKQDRGLVKGRTYKNTMYIVEYSETEKYYVLLEGATPVKTFYETCKEHNQFERNKSEVIFSFYKTLKMLIQDNKEMKDIVKLIYYDGLVSRIIQFRDNEKIEDEQIPEKKLFVLVPSSSFVFNTIKGHQHCSKTRDLTIENVGEKFPEHVRDRGLIRGRSYKTAIYIVEYNRTKYYVLLMDTPLKTFYETCREQKEFEAVKKEVIYSFYYTLEKLIEDNLEMRDIVKLIYYDDENEDLKVPDIVKDRILKKRTKVNEKRRKKIGLVWT